MSFSDCRGLSLHTLGLEGHHAGAEPERTLVEQTLAELPAGRGAPGEAAKERDDGVGSGWLQYVAVFSDVFYDLDFYVFWIFPHP